ncbi:WecB/TagA/CpsF family glycosyltransferase [bacterium]|nr:WecB/TagA/CpsF family glycosyltransferase [bacterium]
MNSTHRITFMGCPMDAITMKETLRLIEESMRGGHRLQHVVVNVAKLVALQTDKELFDDVTGSDLINIDGAGVVLGCRMFGLKVPERVAGVDIMTEVLALCNEKGYRPYILGAKPEVLEKAVANIQARWPNIQFAGWHHGYFSKEEEADVVRDIAASNAHCLFIAMTTPHKERLMGRYKDGFHVPFIMGVGGSVDILAGYTKRAPLWMQKAGLEWLYRVLQEPRRMWKRYFTTNSRFAGLLVKYAIKRW